MGGKKISALTESTTVPSNSYTIIVDGTVNKKIKLETITKDLSDRVDAQDAIINNLSNRVDGIDIQDTTINNLSNKVNEQGTTITNLSNKVDAQEIVTNSLSDRVNEVNEQLDNKVNKIFEFYENYESVITNDKIKDYSYNQLINDINLLVNKYSDKVTKEFIGNSVLGREINALILGNKNGTNKLLVFSGHHAREQHMASLILKQIELYCENWERSVNGEKISDIFNNSAIFFIPSINPDGLELCRIGIDSIPSSDIERINKVKSSLEFKMQNNIKKGADVSQDWDLYGSIIWNGDKGKIPNYSFRNEDMYIWKSNANGVDLHYNCWEIGVNEDILKSYANSQQWPTSFASENYIGATGMGEPENIALKSFIDKYNLWRYSISYHGRGPTVFWNYKQVGNQVQRNHRITDELSDIANTIYSETNNLQIGYVGYMYLKGDTLTYACTRETGWSNKKRNKDNNYNNTTSNYDVCPLSDFQLPWIWEAEKNIPLYLLAKYCRRQDLKTRDINITKYDVDVSKILTLDNYKLRRFNNDNDGIFEHFNGLKEYWGSTSLDFTNSNKATRTITLNQPIPTKNLGGYANCNSTTLTDEVIQFYVSKNSLTEITITAICQKAITRTVPVNWYLRGF